MSVVKCLENLCANQLRCKYYISVAKNGLNLKYVPISNRCFDICVRAMRQDLDSYNYVPPKYRSFISASGHITTFDPNIK